MFSALKLRNAASGFLFANSSGGSGVRSGSRIGGGSGRLPSEDARQGRVGVSSRHA